MPWWGWIVFGALLFGSELMMIDAGFYLVFIGLAAVVTGLVELAGFTLEPWAQWLVFAALSLVAMVLFRKKLYNKLKATRIGYEVGPVGDSIQLNETLAPGARTRMPYRGSDWTVLNTGSESVAQGDYAQITRVDGLTLEINSASTPQQQG